MEARDSEWKCRVPTFTSEKYKHRPCSVIRETFWMGINCDSPPRSVKSVTHLGDSLTASLLKQGHKLFRINKFISILQSFKPKTNSNRSSYRKQKQTTSNQKYNATGDKGPTNLRENQHHVKSNGSREPDSRQKYRAEFNLQSITMDAGCQMKEK